MKIVAFIPAKGTSNRIPSKNIKLLNGKPLFHYVLETLQKCEFIDEIYVDSESDEIFDSIKYGNYRKFKRNHKLATNKTDGNKLFFNEISQVPDADLYIQILPTSPFIRPETIKKSVEILTNGQMNYDSVVLVKKERQYIWCNNKPQYDLDNIPNSNNLEETTIETMGMYITNRQVAHERKKRIGKKPYLMTVDSVESVDINYQEDFKFAELIASGLKLKEIKRFRLISKHISSALLSDILDEFGVENTLSGFSLNIENKKVLGVAKTLKIRKLKDGENAKGIYDALKSYDYLTENDIIIVQNELSEYAYFGELNANLAISKGVSAVIIDGKTRDYSSVRNLDFPIFSKGNTPIDVKGRATIESINEVVEIGGIFITPGDIVFADNEGINIIPNNLIDKVLLTALNRLNIEQNIVQDILNENDIENILKKNGPF